MKRAGSIIALAAIMAIGSPVRADDVDAKDKKIAELEAKVTALEKRVAAMEKMTAPMQADAHRKVLRDQFNRRMAQDQKKYTPEQLGEAEQLYQIMNKQFRTDAGKQALQTMIEKYPDINRTGCAYLYLGQVTTGDEQEKNLRLAIEKYGDCMYGDGVQVGAYARWMLAGVLKKKGDAAGAKALLDEIRKDYPGAVDHTGDSLESHFSPE